MEWDIAILGGGAAGLAAAVFAARERPGCRILILEKERRVGRKLLATGNGTCNLSNRDLDLTRYHGTGVAAAEPVLAAFPPARATEFFRSIGLLTRVKDDGRIYPISGQAAAVLNCLRLEASAMGARMVCAAEVRAIAPSARGFTVRAGTENVTARCVLAATGGAASPGLGGSRSGYGLLTALGHHCTPLRPSIVQLRTDTAYIKAMQGLRVADGRIRLEAAGHTAESRGEILFTEYGLSGPAALAVSRLAGEWELAPRGAALAHIDFLPDWDAAALTSELEHRCRLPGRTMEDYLTGLLPGRIGQTLVRAAGLPLAAPVSQSERAPVAAVGRQIKNFTIALKGTAGLAGAQVTNGGIPIAEFMLPSLESTLTPGLFAAGEVLDVDGDCGGYNLQWAWASAYAAALGMTRRLSAAY